MLPYFAPPPVPLTCVWLNPRMSPRAAHPEFSSFSPASISGPGFAIPNGTLGPTKTFPPASAPRKGSTCCATCALNPPANTSHPSNAAKTYHSVLFICSSIFNSCVDLGSQGEYRTRCLAHQFVSGRRRQLPRNSSPAPQPKNEQIGVLLRYRPQYLLCCFAKPHLKLRFAGILASRRHYLLQAFHQEISYKLVALQRRIAALLRHVQNGQLSPVGSFQRERYARCSFRVRLEICRVKQ